jgi:hypothetical protein
VARGLASLGVEFSEEAVEPVTGYRVDMLLLCGESMSAGRCAVEVGIDTIPLIALHSIAIILVVVIGLIATSNNGILAAGHSCIMFPLSWCWRGSFTWYGMDASPAAAAAPKAAAAADSPCSVLPPSPLLPPTPLSLATPLASLHPLVILALLFCHLPTPPSLCLPQVDGPSHFVALAGGGWRPNGATQLKRRLLGRVGWRVVSVPYWEWDACAGPAEQAAYLRRLLPGPA